LANLGAPGTNTKLIIASYRPSYGILTARF